MKNQNEREDSLPSSSQYCLGSTGSWCILLSKEACAALSKVTGKRKIKKYSTVEVRADKLPHS